MKLPYDPKFHFTVNEVMNDFGMPERTAQNLINKLNLKFVGRAGNAKLYSRLDYEKVRNDVESRRKIYEIIVVRETWCIFQSKLNFM